jgi:hypothetical protein
VGFDPHDPADGADTGDASRDASVDEWRDGDWGRAPKADDAARADGGDDSGPGVPQGLTTGGAVAAMVGPNDWLADGWALPKDRLGDASLRAPGVPNAGVPPKAGGGAKLLDPDEPPNAGGGEND